MTHTQSIAYNEIKIKGRGWLIIFKTIEEIRKGVGYNQTDFANSVGMSYRTYQERISKTQPNWKISELVEIADYNNGKLQVDYEGETYNITIIKQ